MTTRQQGHVIQGEENDVLQRLPVLFAFLACVLHDWTIEECRTSPSETSFIWEWLWGVGNFLQKRDKGGCVVVLWTRVEAAEDALQFYMDGIDVVQCLPSCLVEQWRPGNKGEQAWQSWEKFLTILSRE